MSIALGQVATLRAGYPFRAGIPHDPTGRIAVVQGRDVSPELLRLSLEGEALTRIDGGRIRNLADHLLRPGDVILMARGPRNYAVVVGEEITGEILVTGSFHVVSPDEQSVVPEFLAWLLNQESSQSFMRSNNSGTIIPMISLDVLRALPVLLPPLEVQGQVARLNGLIEQEHTLMTQLASTRRELLRGWANHQASHV